MAGKILWARQMERQLRLLSVRLSDVLGDGWENHVDGRPLKAVCDELLRNLDTQRWGCLSLRFLALLTRVMGTKNARCRRFSVSGRHGVFVSIKGVPWQWNGAAGSRGRSAVCNAFGGGESGLGA